MNALPIWLCPVAVSLSSRVIVIGRANGESVCTLYVQSVLKSFTSISWGPPPLLLGRKLESSSTTACKRNTWMRWNTLFSLFFYIKDTLHFIAYWWWVLVSVSTQFIPFKQMPRIANAAGDKNNLGMVTRIHWFQYGLWLLSDYGSSTVNAEKSAE